MNEGPTWRILPLNEQFDVSDFESLDSQITAYLKSGKALKDMHSGQAAVFVLVDSADTVQGFYTLSAASIDCKAHFTNSQAKAFGYPQVAVTLLGRVAIHKNLKGQGLGTDLILHALRKAALASETVGSYAVVLDAKNERVAALYSTLGFVAFKDQPLKMFLPMSTIRQLL